GTPAGNLSPWDLISRIPAVQERDFAAIPDLPPLLLAFAASFVLGALAAVLAVIGWAPRLLALLAALLPFGLCAYVWFSARDQVEQFGPVLPTGGFGDVLEGLTRIAGFGFWLWIGAAVLLLLAALLDPGDDY